MNLSIHLIEAFIALEETRRFSMAAERCHVSPSAFSQMISRLEERLEVRLFDRDTRNVVLTPEGEVFAQRAHRIVAESRAALAELKGLAERSTGRVAIACPPSLCSSWLPEVLAQFRAKHPGIALQLHDVVSDRCLNMIAHGDVDFGLNARRGNEQEFETRLLFNERLFLICLSADPLTKAGKIRLADLHERDFIHTIRTGSIWQQMQMLLNAVAIRDSGFEVTELATLTGLISAGFGVSIVGEQALPLCKRPGLAAVPIIDPTAVRPIYMVKRRHRSLSTAATDMWERLFQASPR